MTKRHYSQNFLIDPLVVHRIVQAIAPQASDTLLEIGPGTGALTQFLVPAVQHFMAVEVDHALIAPLQQQFAIYDHFTLIEKDILTFPIDDHPWIQAHSPIRVVGNLPYHISTPLMFYLLQANTPITDMHFMLQKEVVDRMAATPGSKTYGRLSVMCQYHSTIYPLFTVDKSAFNPIPQVQSKILRCIPYKTLPFEAHNYSHFSQLVRTAFQHRRKTLRNALKTWHTSASLENLGINPQARPETLSVEQYVRLSNAISCS
ncbi:MAG: 16S rRNA (adenine(1518)-N(6)/adenine(1519)-N(6))-dimethyltransferase RsmA [Gammaproteobacteria bacterium]